MFYFFRAVSLILLSVCGFHSFSWAGSFYPTRGLSCSSCNWLSCSYLWSSTGAVVAMEIISCEICTTFPPTLISFLNCLMIHRPVKAFLSSPQQKHWFSLSSPLISTVNPLVPLSWELELGLLHMKALQLPQVLRSSCWFPKWPVCQCVNIMANLL